MPDDQRTLASLQQKLGVEFRRPEILREALTHTSFVNEQPCAFAADNERLEFLGDAVLDFLVGEELFRRNPTACEGTLTAMRAALVKTDSVARAARAIDLGSHLFLGRGEEASGGRNRSANLCAAMEAVIGAVYLDQDIHQARHVVLMLLSEAIEDTEVRTTRDAKSLLQERVQARQHSTPFYRTASESGPDHAKEFVVEAIVGNRVVGSGMGSSKQAAEQAAAQAALASPELQDSDPPGDEHRQPQER